MLVIRIRFESSWTNSLARDHGQAPLFDSGSALTGSAKGIAPPDASLLSPGATATAPPAAAWSRLSYLRELQRLNPQLLYRVPESFDGAVLGVLARLIGEVRRVKDLESDHLALRAIRESRWNVDIEHEHSQLISLTSAVPNDIQTGGAGLIANEALYGPTEEARLLFGFLGMSLRQMEAQAQEIADGAAHTRQWFPSSPSALIDRLAALDEEQAAILKATRKASADAAGLPAVQPAHPLPGLVGLLAREMPELVAASIKKNRAAATFDKPLPLTIEEGAIDGWSPAGALVVLRIRRLEPEQRQAAIARGVLTAKGGLAGLAMTGNVGKVTPKDVFKFASGRPAQSHRLPYRVEIPVQIGDKKYFVPTAVIKKKGTATIEIGGAAALQDEVEQAIRAAAVGPFHFGKKGVAYVDRLRRVVDDSNQSGQLAATAASAA